MSTSLLRLTSVLLALAPSLAGCFYPPVQAPPPPEKRRVLLPLPYDLTLDAVSQVVKDHNYQVHANDPTNGVIEAETTKFSGGDADCGRVGTALGKESAEPGLDSSAVYNFYIKPSGREASTVTVQAVFSTPVGVPFHTLRNVECVSRGVQEAKLLKDIQERAALIRRPEYRQPADKIDLEPGGDSATPGP